MNELIEQIYSAYIINNTNISSFVDEFTKHMELSDDVKKYIVEQITIKLNNSQTLYKFFN
jgi:hypothetical protein